MKQLKDDVKDHFLRCKIGRIPSRDNDDIEDDLMDELILRAPLK